MSILSDFEADIRSQLFDPDGVEETITYKSGTESKEILAIAEIGNTNMPNASEKDHAYMDALFSVLKSDVPSPQSGDKIIHRGVTYDFYSIQEYSSGIYRLRFTYGLSAMPYM